MWGNYQGIIPQIRPSRHLYQWTNSQGIFPQIWNLGPIWNTRADGMPTTPSWKPNPYTNSLGISSLIEGQTIWYRLRDSPDYIQKASWYRLRDSLAYIQKATWYRLRDSLAYKTGQLGTALLIYAMSIYLTRTSDYKTPSQ